MAMSEKISGANIVVIGDGTGSFVLLSGLKKYVKLESRLWIYVADDMSSTRQLRDELGFAAGRCAPMFGGAFAFATRAETF